MLNIHRIDIMRGVNVKALVVRISLVIQEEQ